ncbi:hypothetical protein [Streptomyces sp. NBC_00829]|uniref:hypothetical protein n=1 Tax=Streptomyces sp. NBC_00829 TaxID=2903679 RepID=UPI003866CC05
MLPPGAGDVHIQTSTHPPVPWEIVIPAREVLLGLGKGEVAVVEHTRKLTVPVAGGAKLLAEVIRELDTRGVEIDDIGLRRPTLDDVFISLTGHVAELEAEVNDEAQEPAGATGAKGRKSRKESVK